MPAPRHRAAVDRLEEVAVDIAPRSLTSRRTGLSTARATRNAQSELHAHRQALDELDERLRQVRDHEHRPAA